jgi:deoxycytidine triphosphate deaminase
MLSPETELEFAASEEEANDRAKKFKRFDPFPDIPPALLSSAEIEDYARVTAMLFPFSPNPDALKPASYEVKPGRKFVWWSAGVRIEEEIRESGTYELPPNSIRYMQISPKLRLPDYIAIRFNLRIKHVHRGLLLGTGPLVDPGFVGEILIPLHNLTSDSHRIRGNEGLIWIEFTKTSASVRRAVPSYTRRGRLVDMDPLKTDVSVETYLQRANDGRPILSSIPEAMRESAVKAEQAATDAENARQAARRTGLIYSSIAGITAVALIATLIFMLHQYLGQVYANVQTTLSLASGITTNSDQAKADAARAIEDEQALKQNLEIARTQIEDLRGQLGNVTRELERLQQQPVSQPASPSRR